MSAKDTLTPAMTPAVELLAAPADQPAGHGAHVCFLSSAHPPFDKRVFDKEAVTLASAGYRVTHLCPSQEGARRVRGVDVATYTPPRGLLGRATQLLRLYRRASAIDADIYHCNEVDSWMVGVALRLLRGKRCVFDVHEHYPTAFADGHLPAPLRPLAAHALRLLFRLMLPFTERIVFAKRSVAPDYPTRPGQALLVQNFTPRAALPVQHEAEVEYPRPAGKVRLIHLGLISRVRGWPQLLDALHLLGPEAIELDVVGEFNDGSKPDFDSRAAALGLAERITYADWMPFEEAFRRILASDIGLVLFQPGIQNHVFALPHKMFDYMLAGLPVIVPDFAVEVAPIVREADCGFAVDSSDPRAIAAAIARLAGDAGLRQRMGENGRRAVLERYNWESEGAKLVAMYRELTAQ